MALSAFFGADLFRLFRNAERQANNGIGTKSTCALVLGLCSKWKEGTKDVLRLVYRTDGLLPGIGPFFARVYWAFFRAQLVDQT